MHRALAAFAAIIAQFAFISSNAEAQEWILCTNCSTPADFQSAAISRTPNATGEFSYSVGNPESGELNHVTVFRTMPGEQPLFEDGPVEILLDGRTGDAVGIFIPENNPVVTLPRSSTQIQYGTSSGQTHSNISQASSEDTQTFINVVQLHDGRALLTSPSDLSGFESFHSAMSDQTTLNHYLWTSMIAFVNPMWPASELSGGWLSLFNVFKSLNGE